MPLWCTYTHVKAKHGHPQVFTWVWDHALHVCVCDEDWTKVFCDICTVLCLPALYGAYPENLTKFYFGQPVSDLTCNPCFSHQEAR